MKIDVWGNCPICNDKWDKKSYSNISFVKYADGKETYKCPKCLTEWVIGVDVEYQQTWKQKDLTQPQNMIM